MSAYLWLISETLLLLTLAASFFFVMGWRWQGQRARARVNSLEGRLDTEVGMAKQARDERDTLVRRLQSNDGLSAELQEAEERQQVLQKEMLRLRDEKREMELAVELALAKSAEVKVADSQPPEDTKAEPVQGEAEQPREEKDDLTRIRGVGAVLSRKLAAAGVTRFRQLASLTEDEMTALDGKLALRGRMRRDDWQEQARELQKESAGRQGR